MRNNRMPSRPARLQPARVHRGGERCLGVISIKKPSRPGAVCVCGVGALPKNHFSSVRLRATRHKHSQRQLVERIASILVPVMSRDSLRGMIRALAIKRSRSRRLAGQCLHACRGEIVSEHRQMALPQLRELFRVLRHLPSFKFLAEGPFCPNQWADSR